MNKKNLAIQLSKLKQLEKFDVSLEQYPIDSNLASEILWNALQNNDLSEKVVVDFGCGNGILGVGALLLGAKLVYFLDKDRDVLKICKENIESLDFKNFKLINKDILDFDIKVDTVVMNPPFGVQKRKADKDFLEVAMKNSQVIYSVHKIESKNFINQLVVDYGFEVRNVIEKEFIIGKLYEFHTKEKHGFKVGIWVLRKI
jgi:putative methylase